MRISTGSSTRLQGYILYHHYTILGSLTIRLLTATDGLPGGTTHSDCWPAGGRRPVVHSTPTNHQADGDAVLRAQPPPRRPAHQFPSGLRSQLLPIGRLDHWMGALHSQANAHPTRRPPSQTRPARRLPTKGHGCSFWFGRGAPKSGGLPKSHAPARDGTYLASGTELGNHRTDYLHH